MFRRASTTCLFSTVPILLVIDKIKLKEQKKQHNKKWRKKIRDGSVVKIGGCSFRGPRFMTRSHIVLCFNSSPGGGGVQHPLLASLNIHRHTCRQNTRVYEIKVKRREGTGVSVLFVRLQSHYFT